MVARPLTPELLPSAAALLAAAFFDNPAHVYVCPDPRRRRAQLERLLGENLRIQPDLRDSFCVARGSVVEAMGFWTRSDAARIGTLARIRAGGLSAPLRLGLRVLRRAFEVAREVDRHLGATLGQEPYWYLNNMAVSEPLRGSGIGTRLLREQLAILAQKEPSFAGALSTQRPENVVFYQRLGFRVAGERMIGSRPGAFRNWVMTRAAAV
jgi:ribosomal protein S18 acetylase RimI-like enzyme